MNNLCIIILILLIVVPILCQKGIKERFFTPGLVHPTTYSFTPYSMNFTRNLSRRGCDASKYWNCVDKSMKKDYNVNNIPEKVDNDCKQYANDQCYFPERLSHSRTEPYYQYLNYI